MANLPICNGNTFVLTTDADWATCKESRQSNSGGTLQLGNHLIAAWSRVQPLINPHNFGNSGVLRVDASACHAIMLRRGCGGLKHITAKSLWFQEAVREYSTAVERVPRDVTHAHTLASSSRAEELRKHLTELNAYRDGGQGLSSVL